MRVLTSPRPEGKGSRKGGRKKFRERLTRRKKTLFVEAVVKQQRTPFRGIKKNAQKELRKEGGGRKGSESTSSRTQCNCFGKTGKNMHSFSGAKRGGESAEKERSEEES